MPGPSRRDFLKLTSMISGALTFSRLVPNLSLKKSAQPGSRPGILIFVFDAMSADNLSLFGYRRKTSPNLERLAQRATVFNAH